MKYRRLGDTGLWVSEVGFGTIPILKGSVPVLPDYYNLEDEQALAVMAYAYSLGCNLYDTAIVPEYGDAEIKLGKFAAYLEREKTESQKSGRERIIISDKARFFDGNDMYQAVETSCENLGTYADIYFVHQVDEGNVDEVFRKGGALDALTELKQEGKIRFAGVASHYYDILLRGAQDARVDVLQGSGNILERGMLDRMAQEERFSHKGFLVNKVYAAGILPTFFSVRTLLQGVLSYPVSSALIGIGAVWQADAAMGSAVSGISEVQAVAADADKCADQCMDKCIDCSGEMQEISFAEVLSTLEKQFFPIPCDRCQRCRCPHGTEIHTLFRQYHYYFLGKDFWALKKLALGIEESAKWCRECTSMPCLSMCPRGIRIPDEIQRVCELVRTHN